MPYVLTGSEHLRNLFAGIAEQTFQVEFGVADPPLIDYLAGLLERFVRVDTVFKVRDIVGRPLEEVADMLIEAEHREATPKREIHRHIGDFTLFWTGVYPEGLKRLKRFDRKDCMINYLEQGKRSYHIASTFAEPPFDQEAEVLKRLSKEYEMCSEGLRRVRAEWEMLPNDQN